METMWGRSKPADYVNFRCVGLRLRGRMKPDYRLAGRSSSVLPPSRSVSVCLVLSSYAHTILSV